MKVLTTIGTIMLVLGFLASAVGAFPLADVSASPAVTEDTPFSTEAVEQTAAQVGAMYTSIIDDLMTFQDNPGLALAESRRVAMTAYAEDLASRFQALCTGPPDRPRRDERGAPRTHGPDGHR